MKVTIPAKTIEVTHCYYGCPYFETSSEGMECMHPSIDTSKNAYARLGIISWNYDIQHGFPPKCPLLKGNK